MRADMDALPMKEETGLPYGSTIHQTDHAGQTVPVAHACGHDAHVASLMGAARLLAANRSEWHGTFVPLFQPAEELGDGAGKMVKGGLAKLIPKPDVALAQHVLAYPAGTVGTHAGAFLSTAASMRITVHGRGSHGSMPQLSVDPVVLAAMIVVRLQSIVAREVTPGDFAVVTVGRVAAGTKSNIIPDGAVIELNIRAYDEGTRTLLLDAIKRVVKGECVASGSPSDPEFELFDEYPLTSNDPDVTTKVAAAFKAHFGDRAFTAPRLSASEDFSAIPDALGVPYTYWALGCIDPEKWREAEAAGRIDSDIPANHSSKFAPRHGAYVEDRNRSHRGRRSDLAGVMTGGVLTTTLPTETGFRGNDRLLLGMILGVLAFWLFAQTVLNIASTMAADLGIEMSVMTIAVSIAALFSGIFMVVIGGGADRVGRVKIVQIGFVLSIVGSLMVGLAPSGALAVPLLMLGRICQGLSAACIMPASLALIKAYWDGAGRQRAVSLWSMGSWGGAGFAALFGGLMAENVGWRWIFIASAAVSVIGMLMVRGTPESRVQVSGDYKLDIKGIATFMVAMVALQVLVTMGGTLGWTSAASLSLLAITLVVGFIFFRVESGNPTAFVDFRLFRNATYTGRLSRTSCSTQSRASSSSP